MSGARIIQSPVLLSIASLTCALLFVLGLAIAAFLLRDAPIAAPPRGAVVVPRDVARPLGPLGVTTMKSPTATTKTAQKRPPLGVAERQSASTAVAPAFPDCYRDARKSDPSLAKEVELVVQLDAKPSGGTITGLHVGRGGSPFLAACLRRQLVGAGFPAGADGVGEVRWRARVEGDRGVLVEIAD